MPAGQRPLDRVLAGKQPIHRLIDVIDRCVHHAEVVREGGVLPPAAGGQLGARADHTRDDQRHRQVPLAAGRAEQPGQAQLAGDLPHQRDVPVRQRPGYLERVGGNDEGLALEAAADQLDRLGRQVRQVRQGLVADLAVLAVATPQQRGLVYLALVVTTSRRHVHRPTTLRHGENLPHLTSKCNTFSDYITWSYEHCPRSSTARFSPDQPRNFGLTPPPRPSPRRRRWQQRGWRWCSPMWCCAACCSASSWS